MQTCVKTALGKVEMMELPDPKPGPDDIVIKTTMATVCGSDMHFLDEIPTEILYVAYPKTAKPPGLSMGHEGVGIVHEVGSNVSRFQPGDRVVASCITGCGKCVQCYSGDYSICTGDGGLIFGCQGDYFVVPYGDINCAKVPDGVSDEQAMLTTDIMSTGFSALERADMKMGDTVAIFAQGPVGLCATAGARARGAGLIITVESIPERMEMSKKFGANVVINYRSSGQAAEATADEARSLGVEALPLQADISDPEQVETMVASAKDRFGGIDILINSASLFLETPFPLEHLQDWHLVLGTALHGSFYCANTVAPLMLAQGEGAIINIVDRSEEHTSELQSHSFISYAVFCLKKKTQTRRKQQSKELTWTPQPYVRIPATVGYLVDKIT